MTSLGNLQDCCRPQNCKIQSSFQSGLSFRIRTWPASNAHGSLYFSNLSIGSATMNVFTGNSSLVMAVKLTQSFRTASYQKCHGLSSHLSRRLWLLRLSSSIAALSLPRRISIGCILPLFRSGKINHLASFPRNSASLVPGYTMASSHWVVTCVVKHFERLVERCERHFVYVMAIVFILKYISNVVNRLEKKQRGSWEYRVVNVAFWTLLVVIQ